MRSKAAEERGAVLRRPSVLESLAAMASPLVPLPPPEERRRMAQECGVGAHVLAAVCGIGMTTFERWSQRPDLPLTPMTDLYHRIFAVLAAHLAGAYDGIGTGDADHGK